MKLCSLGETVAVSFSFSGTLKAFLCLECCFLAQLYTLFKRLWLFSHSVKSCFTLYCDNLRMGLEVVHKLCGA